MIALVPIGRIAPEILEWLEAELRVTFHDGVQLAPALDLPPGAYDATRGQTQTDALLDELDEIRQPEWDRILGVTDVDLYEPAHAYVIAQADAARHVAVFSLERLHSRDTARYRHRAASTAVRILRACDQAST
jgi:predicted Zn-dependent protease